MTPRRSLTLLVAVCLSGLAGLPGCEQTQRLVGPAHPVLPPDFAIRFHVSGRASSDPWLTRTAQYVVEPDRQLRVAFGAEATRDFFPDRIRVVDRAEFYDLTQHIQRYHLMAEPSLIASEDDQATARYDVEITCHGRTHRYVTTARQSPPTTQLLDRLEGLYQRSQATARRTRWVPPATLP